MAFRKFDVDSSGYLDKEEFDKVSLYITSLGICCNMTQE